MPARWSLRKKPEASMAKTDGTRRRTLQCKPRRARAGRGLPHRAVGRKPRRRLSDGKGYRILAKRFRTPYGEIDLVAKKRNLVAFIEVKARASLDDAAYAVTPRQQARIIDAAQGWLMAHPEHAEFELRFDAILIAPRRLPRHLLAAFDASA
jgi:putative endonuclease